MNLQNELETALERADDAITTLEEQLASANARAAGVAASSANPADGAVIALQEELRGVRSQLDNHKKKTNKDGEEREK
jgi:hypothetical protein